MLLNNIGYYRIKLDRIRINFIPRGELLENFKI